MIKLAAVKYLNTTPMLHGLENSSYASDFDLQLEYPAKCADLLLNGDVDIALCPVGALLSLDTYSIISHYGIGCNGAVRTVSIYSDVPFQELKAIRLQKESRSSNLLSKVLEKHYWEHDMQFIEADAPLPNLPTGQLVIGDACFDYESKFEYVTDLGEAWLQLTGLPFLFACWVSLKPIDQEVIQKLNNAFDAGINDIPNVKLPESQPHVDVKHYLQKNIQYHIDEDVIAGMTKFMNYADELSVSLPHVAQTTSR